MPLAGDRHPVSDFGPGLADRIDGAAALHPDFPFLQASLGTVFPLHP